MSEVHPGTFKTINPATGEQINEIAFAGEAAISQSIDDLHDGFLKWKNFSVRERQEKLSAVIESLKGHKTEFVNLITQTMGKPISQSEAEFDKSVEAAEYLCRQEWSVLKTRTILDLKKRHEIRREPIGVIVGVMPWNYPIWQAVRMIFPSLIGGNTVLLKHAEITAAVGELLARVFQDLNREVLVFQHQMFAHTLTEKIVADSRVGGISITGSIRAGRAVGEIAGRHLKKAVLELGGSDPSLVFSDCNMDHAVKAVMRSRFLNSGQVCIATKRVFVERGSLLQFLDKAKQLFQAYKADDPLKAATKIGPLSHPKFKNEFLQQLQAVGLHSQVVAENKLDISPSESAFVSPKILLFDRHVEFFKTNEIFGPALCVIPFDSETEALKLANSTIFGLGASIYTSNKNRIENLTRDIQSGQIAINNSVGSDVKLPFGGQKQSGLGRELGEDGFLEFCQTKVVSYELESP